MRVPNFTPFRSAVDRFFLINGVFDFSVRYNGEFEICENKKKIKISNVVF